jgi:hypothetical protein
MSQITNSSTVYSFLDYAAGAVIVGASSIILTITYLALSALGVLTTGSIVIGVIITVSVVDFILNHHPRAPFNLPDVNQKPSDTLIIQTPTQEPVFRRPDGSIDNGAGVGPLVPIPKTGTNRPPKKRRKIAP